MSIPNNIKNYINQCTLKQIKKLKKIIQDYEDDFISSFVDITNLCEKKNWEYSFESDLDYTFLYIKTSTRTITFFDHDKNVSIALKKVCDKAADYFCNEEIVSKEEVDDAFKKCLSIEADAIEKGIKSYHYNILSGLSKKEAEQIATNMTEKYILNNIETFINYNQYHN